MQNVHGSDGEPGNLYKSKPWWLTIVRNLLRRSMLLSTNTTNQKDFRAVQEVKAKNGVGPDENLPIWISNTISAMSALWIYKFCKKCSEILSCIRQRVHGLINRQASENFFPLDSREYMNIPVANTIMLELCSQSFLHKTLW